MYLMVNVFICNNISKIVDKIKGFPTMTTILYGIHLFSYFSFFCAHSPAAKAMECITLSADSLRDGITIGTSPPNTTLADSAFPRVINDLYNEFPT